MILMALVYCSINVMALRQSPEYKEVDPAVQPYVADYLRLAKEHGLSFDHTVTVGFKDINEGDAVGLTNYGVFFREIDIDKEYWSRSTRTSRIVLVWHELTHSYCGRDHDFNGVEYGDSEEVKKNKPKPEMMFDDGCPRSIMFPSVIPDACFIDHYLELVDEMFQDCETY